eukprot:GHRQ01004889.1.p1 GENE.GHRQ01004889.1~~GHRQ01004889.1.p1  ORF type:complete len:220 (+),score=82.55 GHRQ01004889.1:55-660(+)
MQQTPTCVHACQLPSVIASSGPETVRSCVMLLAMVCIAAACRCSCASSSLAAASAVGAAAPWHLRGQPHSALQTDQQFSSASSVLKQQTAPQQQLAGLQSRQAAQAHLSANGDKLSASDSDSSDSSGPVRVPLKLVVADAVKRWFNEALAEARRGDVKQQALLSQMYAEGYGCKQDAEQSKVWGERARMRGYHMSGVYDAL